MMPGETHSKTAGIASEAAGSCQNCTSLQQSLNEYVAALIALKQKIMDSDQLLAEYQQKCDDLQYAERENETLRCQLEQMLEKISNREQHEEELKSLKVELEEKKSTLKIYQQTEMEYMKVREDCEKSDIAKKKLEAKLKKMEEAAVKHNKEYKQLNLEKSVIGKELKKIQKKLDGFLNEKSKKVTVKNAQTQVEREKPGVTLDQEKIKHLLEQIWGCITSSTENGDHSLLNLDKRLQEKKCRNSKSSPECRPPVGQTGYEIIQTCNPLNEVDTLEASLNLNELNYSPPAESTVVRFTEIETLNEDAAPNILAFKDVSDCKSVNSDFESDIDDIREVQDWAKPLPNLLSPIQCSPLTVENVFGGFTDSSDAESTNDMDQSQLMMENILDRGPDKDHNLKEVEQISVATDSFANPTTACSKDVPDITVETNLTNLEQNPNVLPFQEAQPMVEDHIQMDYEDRSNPLSTSSKESLTDALKIPEPKFINAESCERPLAKIENKAMFLDGENKIEETSCHIAKSEIQLNDKMDISPSCKKTVGCNPSKNLPASNDTEGKITFDDVMGNPESKRQIANKSPIMKDPLVPKELNPDKDILVSVGSHSSTSLDCDQKTFLHKQSENSLESEKSNHLTDFRTRQDLMNNGNTLSGSTNCCKTIPNFVDVDLSKCSEKNLNETLNSTNECIEVTEKPFIRSPEENCTESIEKPLKQNQPSEPLRQTLPFLSNGNNMSTVLDHKVHDLGCENNQEQSSPDNSEDLAESHKNYLEIVADTVDKPNPLPMSLKKHNSTTATSIDSQCKTIDQKNIGLEKCSSQKERISQHEPEQHNCDLGMDRMAGTSIFHGDNNKHEKSLLETSDKSSTALAVSLLDASTVIQNIETEQQCTQVGTCNEDHVCSPKLVICEDNLSTPSTVHLDEKCTPCSKTSIDNTSLDVEKAYTQASNPISVISSSPVHTADFEHTNVENIIKAQCQEGTLSVNSSMDLNPSILEEKSTILSPHSNSESIPVKVEPCKILPVVPLAELQHLCVPLESKDNKDTTDVDEESQDSSESEYEFPVRRVNLTRAALNSPVVGSKSFQTADVKGSGNDELVVVTELEEQRKPPINHDEIEGQMDAVIEPLNSNNSKVETDTLMAPTHLVLCKELKKGEINDENTVECSSNEKSKDVAFKDSVRKAEDSDHVHSGNDDEKDTRNNTETGGQRILPGKNLIWNFSRNDDIVDPRAVCLTQKRKTNPENVSANLENSVSKICAGTGKTRENDRSNKLKSSNFQTLRKENPSPRLSQVGTVPVSAQVGQTVLANADTSTNTGHSPETISKVRSEMGPPLRPLLGPLLSTPPRSLRPLSPIMSSSSHSSLPSPLDEMISPLPGTPFPPLMSPLSDGRKRKSPVFNTPSPAEKANRRILSSPLQFCAATPKHAVPVPGRLPLSANGSATCNVQENSVKILDTMYPELSARARTLNILKGNVHLNRGMSGDGQNAPVSQITGFKSITSTSTVFIKTGSNSKSSNKEKPDTCETKLSSENCNSVNKRAVDSFQMPKSAKRLRLDSESPVAERVKDCFTTRAKNLDAHKDDESGPNFSCCEPLPDIVKGNIVDEDIITNALKKVEELCFDLLPVIRSHIFVGTVPKVPVMRNEEKEVIHDFSSSKKGLADRFLQVLLKKIKTERSLEGVYLQALCRVYVGLCRQLGDIERARILCYCILKEDYPDPAKLLLFIISSWNDILSLHGVVNKAVQALLKILAKDEVGYCLSAYLNWEKTPPMNTSVLLNSVLMAIQLYPDVKFHESEKYGEDLTDNVWEYVFAIDLLCSQRKWIWTHENVISKELWPILDKWVKRKKGNLTCQFVPNMVVATVLRLIGHLCQMGLREGFITAVKNITSVIIAFIKHANEEGVPWGVQLASVYMLCDTAACEPSLIHQTLQAWKETAQNSLPPAVINCMQEVASLCVSDK